MLNFSGQEKLSDKPGGNQSDECDYVKNLFDYSERILVHWNLHVGFGQKAYKQIDDQRSQHCEPNYLQNQHSFVKLLVSNHFLPLLP
jgi:hypothetical protein